MPPSAVNIAELPLHIVDEGTVILVGPTDGWFTVISFVTPPVVAVQGEVVF